MTGIEIYMLITAIMSALTAAASVASQQEAADAQEKMNDTSLKAMTDQYTQSMKELGQQQMASNEQSAKEQDKFNLEEAQAQARVTVKAAETGAGGGTLAALKRDVERQNLNRISDTKRTNFYNQLQIRNQQVAAGLRYKGQSSSLPAVQKPDYAGAALNFGSSVVNSFYQAKQMEG